MTLKFEDVSHSIKYGKSFWSASKVEGESSRILLNGVSGIAHPGELLAVLGPSGGGKTTLLAALGGRLREKIRGGSITYNGNPFSTSVKRAIGFVAQDDVLYPQLTVVETLTYAALLRLPKHLTRQQKAQQAELLIAELGLARVMNNMVGGGLVRGLSGGERKRVSIGQELLLNPSLLLLDEPTSGLDSTTAHNIVTTLCRLAQSGRTVVTTIHQPSTRVFAMFHNIVVLSQGCPIYTGQSGRVMDYFSSIGFQPESNFVNPSDFLLDLANGVSGPELEDDPSVRIKSLVSAYRAHIYPLLKAEIQHKSNYPLSSYIRTKSCSKGDDRDRLCSWWEEFNVLLQRGLRQRKPESYSGLRIFHVLTVSIVSGLLWWQSSPSNIQDQVGLLFFFSLFWGFFPLSNAIFAFPIDRPMLRRELSSGMYRLSSYYFARTIGDMPMELLLPTIYTTITYLMAGLNRSTSVFLLTLSAVLLNVLVSQSFGLALGALVMEPKRATTLTNVIMLVFLLAGGYYVQHVPRFMAWLKYLSFSHYSYKLLVGVQYSRHDTYQCEMGRHCSLLEFPALKSLLIQDKRWDLFALILMLLVFRLVAYLTLRLKKL